MSFSPSRIRNAARRNTKKARKSEAKKQLAERLQVGEAGDDCEIVAKTFAKDELQSTTLEIPIRVANWVEPVVPINAGAMLKPQTVQAELLRPMTVAECRPATLVHAGGLKTPCRLRIGRAKEVGAKNGGSCLLVRVKARAETSQGRAGAKSITESESQYQVFLVWKASDAWCMSRSEESANARYDRFLAWQSGVRRSEKGDGGAKL
jgi:hypothetical protein